jgi:hypothetical protein
MWMRSDKSPPSVLGIDLGLRDQHVGNASLIASLCVVAL